MATSTSAPHHSRPASGLVAEIDARLAAVRAGAGAPAPVDARIQAFLDRYLSDVRPGGAARLPARTLVLDRAGLARELSLPPDRDSFSSDIVTSYRVAQGVLHNPKSDRRTTQGVFHVAEGGLAIPDDKVAVPKAVFAALLEAAMRAPESLTRLPFTSTRKDEAHVFVSLLLRPLVCPAAGPFGPAKRMEIRFFAPGSLVSNLDFVEMIFGNGGDPGLPANDAALDPDGWTGHTGCVILAPHLITTKKKDLGLPHVDQATERQRRDGQCWTSPDELYNNGQAFKITARTMDGVIVTVIADNYFGYCKKEVKTQIGFSANLFGLAEEEHSGGAIAFPSYILGQDFHDHGSIPMARRTFEEALAILGANAEPRPEGHAVDRRFSNIVYVPEGARFNLRDRSVSWSHGGREGRIKLLADQTYVLPSGYKVRMEKQIGGPYWRLIGTVAEGTLCHKPCTVSGGGKSEISKSISYAMLAGPVFVRDFHKDLDEVDAVLRKDFTVAARDPKDKPGLSRPILSPERSLGSVIKLLTPSPRYTDEYNAWVRAIPQTIRQLVFVAKRYCLLEWGDDWRRHFSVDRINGYLAHELKFDGQKLVSHYLRVGLDRDGSWRVYKLRSDFNPADKVQVEDDITASVVVPNDALTGLPVEGTGPSVKLVQNCESKLFQRPDDAIHRGYDHQAEADLATSGTFLSNFEPFTRDQVRALVEDRIDFDLYTEPMKRLLRESLNPAAPDFTVSSAHPRIVDGKPSKNPRYLQNRPDLVNADQTYLAEVGGRLARGVPFGKEFHFIVNAVLAGRRNNPPDYKLGVPPLAVYNPVHYQELPELFMDFTCSLTGKSPSTTGFGSEGALTKGPFNALWPVIDLNNALLSMILTGYPGFTTAAGYVGPFIQVEHDISLLVPEIWSRMRIPERDPRYLIENGYLEKLDDYVFNGRTVRASRLGYRITARFADEFLGRIFEAPGLVMPEEILKPETQDAALYAAGIDAIVEAQQRVAGHYFADGSVDAACPPLKALLHIMAKGSFEGKTVDHPEIRAMFRREEVLKSDWYRERLVTKQKRDIALWTRHVDTLSRAAGTDAVLAKRLAAARETLAAVSSPAHLDRLVGTIGADPFTKQA